MFAEIGYQEQVEAMLEKHHHDPEMLSKVMCLYKNKKVSTFYANYLGHLFKKLSKR
jgi:hypothetical protein